MVKAIEVQWYNGCLHNLILLVFVNIYILILVIGQIIRNKKSRDAQQVRNKAISS
jgi:hypothetical protein